MILMDSRKDECKFCKHLREDHLIGGEDGQCMKCSCERFKAI